MDLTDKPLRLRDGATAWREVDGEVIVLDLERSVYLGVNESGVALWRALEEGTSVPAMVDLLVTTYGIAAEQARGDVDAFVEGCAARNLLDA